MWDTFKILEYKDLREIYMHTCIYMYMNCLNAFLNMQNIVFGNQGLHVNFIYHDDYFLIRQKTLTCFIPCHGLMELWASWCQQSWESYLPKSTSNWNTFPFIPRKTSSRSLKRKRRSDLTTSLWSVWFTLETKPLSWQQTWQTMQIWTRYGCHFYFWLHRCEP